MHQSNLSRTETTNHRQRPTVLADVCGEGEFLFLFDFTSRTGNVSLRPISSRFKEDELVCLQALIVTKVFFSLIDFEIFL